MNKKSRYILGYGITMIILSLIDIGGFVAIIYLLQSDTFGPLKYHISIGIYVFSILINSVVFAALLNTEEKEL